ncbi:hypothetical protein PAPYR_2804 [Paratrimastix pyriformis]|uniref:Uncharacterized protein n=1 Tax=Paratrimastix pyriformis TaxID=342808 RepID=A0ABQ8UR68_9EUKA|nr:hypothetical protein PAPYR_2804 [Paratrimastix pyriformis]
MSQDDYKEDFEPYADDFDEVGDTGLDQEPQPDDEIGQVTGGDGLDLLTAPVAPSPPDVRKARQRPDVCDFLEVSDMCFLLDVPPTTESQQLLLRQAVSLRFLEEATQTRADNTVEKEIMTDPTNDTDRAVQVPDGGGGTVAPTPAGLDSSRPATSAASPARSPSPPSEATPPPSRLAARSPPASPPSRPGTSASGAPPRLSTTRLVSFLKAAGLVMEALLEENIATAPGGMEAGRADGGGAAVTLSQGLVARQQSLGWPGLTDRRDVTALCFAPTDPRVLVAAYAPQPQPAVPLAPKGVAPPRPGTFEIVDRPAASSAGPRASSPAGAPGARAAPTGGPAASGPVPPDESLGLVWSLHDQVPQRKKLEILKNHSFGRIGFLCPAWRSLGSYPYLRTAASRIITTPISPPASAVRFDWRACRLLGCPNRITCLCVAPGSPNIILAGTAEGTLCLWDLRESITLHKYAALGDDVRVVHQRPSYSTAWTGPQAPVNHRAPVIRLIALDAGAGPRSAPRVSATPVTAAIPTPPGTPAAATRSSRSATQQPPVGAGGPTPMNVVAPFQVCSVDEFGTVIVWTVTQTEPAPWAGSESDLGQAGGSCMRVLMTARLNYGSRLATGGSFVAEASAGGRPGRASGDADGWAAYEAAAESQPRGLGSRGGGEAAGAPSCTAGAALPARPALVVVTEMAACPGDSNQLLLGTSCGLILRVSRHGADRHPVLFMPPTPLGCAGGAAVLSLSFSPADGNLFLATFGDGSMRSPWCDSQFFVFNQPSRLSVWDVARSDLAPTASFPLRDPKQAPPDASRIIASAAPPATSLGVHKRWPCLAVGFQRGAIEIHYLSPRLVDGSPAHAQQLHTYAYESAIPK